MSESFPSLTQTFSSTSGTADFVLNTAVLSGPIAYLRTPKQAVADGDLFDGDTVYYNVIDKAQVGGALFELGRGVYDDTANTIARTAANVIGGSSGPGVLVVMPGSGQRDVLILDQIPRVSSRIAADNSLRITPAGEVVIGDDAMNSARLGQALEIVKSADFGGLSLGSWSATDNQGSTVEFNKSSSNTIGTQAIVADDERLGFLLWRASDGVAFITAAQIRAEVDGTPGVSDMPTRLVFLTTGAGSSSVSERMSIGSDGHVSIGIDSGDGDLHVHSGSAGAVTANASADELVVEGAGEGGITILTPDASLGNLFFGSPSDNVGCSVSWLQSGTIMSVGTNISGGILRLRTDVGLPALTIDANQKSQFIGQLELGSGGPTINAGSGSPESVVTAPIGSTFHRTDGGAGTSFYVKESGVGNTGWVAK